MKTIHFLLAGLMVSVPLGACSAPSDQESPTASPATTGTTVPSPESSQAGETMPKHASATGTIEAIDPAARTITIAHGPVPELEWPAMTMTFQAPGVDLSGFEQGDRISFEFSASGMAATVTALEHE